MRKKYLSALLFGALFVASTGTFTSCKDYDDDINNLQTQIDDVKAAVAELQSKVDGGKSVTNIVKEGDGIKSHGMIVHQLLLKQLREPMEQL